MIEGYATETRAGEHGPIVVRTASTDPARHQLAQEADRLDRSRHPGVVELLRATDDELTMAWAGAQTLELLVAPIPALSGVLTSVASTVADLHEIGMIHGRLDASHVVIDADGRPRLCGMRGPTPDERTPLPTDDVAAIGALIDHLMGPDTEIEPIPERRWSRRRWTGYQRRALQLVADRATHEDPARRPTARELAAAIAEAVPDARVVAPPTAVTAPQPTISPPAVDDHQGTDPAADAAPPEPVHREPPPPLPPPPPPPAIPPAVEAAAPQPAEAPAPPPVGALPASPSAPLRFLGLRLEAPASEPEEGESAPDGTRRAGHRAELPHATTSEVPSRRRRTILVAAAVPLALALAVSASDALSHERPSHTATSPPSAAPPVTNGHTDGPTATAAPAPTLAPTPTPTPSATRPPTPRDCRSSGRPASPMNRPDLDGDGCPDAVEVDGTHVTADGVRFEVGEQGDRVEVADWNCDGRATAAIVRPGTGEIFVFSQWVRADEPLSVAPTAVVTGAVALVPPTDVPCTTRHLVRVVGGTTVPVDLDGGHS